jgi:hypothetical protein
MLNNLMLATLDNDTHREWELITGSRENTPTTAELVTFLESSCRALELIQNIQSPSMLTINPRATTQSAGSNVSKPLYCHVATQIQCALCNGSHKLFKCDKFLKLRPRQRHNHAKQQGLCFNCLQPFVRNHTCSKQVCHQCHKTSTLLHIDKQHQVGNANRFTTNNQSPAITKIPTIAEVHSYQFLKDNPRNILLATAVVEVRDKTG